MIPSLKKNPSVAMVKSKKTLVKFQFFKLEVRADLL